MSATKMTTMVNCGVTTKKGRGSMREQLRAMQRHNRRYSGYTNHKGVQVKPRDERIKRNHMQTVNAEIRMHNAMIRRVYDYPHSNIDTRYAIL